MRAVDNKLDVISGGPDFDTAFVDQIFDVFIDGVEDIRKVASVGRLRLAPRVLKAEAGMISRLKVGWKHPQAWRELRKVKVSLYDGKEAVGTIDVRPAAGRLASTGVVDLKATRCKVRHHGKWVTASLAMSLPKSLADQDLRVDVRRSTRTATSSSSAPRARSACAESVCVAPARGLRDPEAVEQRLVAAPRAAHADREVEVHARAELALELAPRRDADRLDHAAVGADQDALLGLGLDHSSARTITSSLLLDDLVDLHLDRVRDLLARAVQDLLAHQLGQHHALGLVGHVVGREVERALRAAGRRGGRPAPARRGRSSRRPGTRRRR